MGATHSGKKQDRHVARSTGAIAPVTGRSPTTRSLERGLAILRCFRPGLGALGNNEIVERTNLPKATVSRLMQTLVRSGFLKKDVDGQTYRLSFSVLSLAHAAMLDSQVMHEAMPLMHELGETHHVNVGLSAPDDMEMVYLHVVHGDRFRLTRRIEPGHRRALEMNAVGRAYIASLDAASRTELMDKLSLRHPDNWKPLSQAIEQAVIDVATLGYCSVVWGHGTESTAMPLVLNEGVFVLNVSYSVEEFPPALAREAPIPALIEMGRALKARLSQSEPG